MSSESAAFSLGETLVAQRVQDDLVLLDEASGEKVFLSPDAREALVWALAALWPEEQPRAKRAAPPRKSVRQSNT